MESGKVIIAGHTLDNWTLLARRDDCCTGLVPSDLRQLVGEIVRLRSALERTVQALATCDAVGEPHPTHDAVIVGLAKVAGSGPMMKALVHEWSGHLRLIHDRASPAWNHFTVGPTRDTLESALRVGRDALKEQNR